MDNKINIFAWKSSTNSQQNEKMLFKVQRCDGISHHPSTETLGKYIYKKRFDYNVIENRQFTEWKNDSL